MRVRSYRVARLHPFSTSWSALTIRVALRRYFDPTHHEEATRLPKSYDKSEYEDAQARQMFHSRKIPTLHNPEIPPKVLYLRPLNSSLLDQQPGQVSNRSVDKPCRRSASTFIIDVQLVQGCSVALAGRINDGRERRPIPGPNFKLSRITEYY
ncbi:Cystathionine beta-synthase [Venturia inaequalis]|nr:Cystathionine beta-synthase [Venturia inaequalis]